MATGLRIFVRWYTYILIVFSSIIIVSDANLYSYWGFRMDYTPMMYLKTPGEAMASVSTFTVILYFSAIILMSGISIYLYNKFIDRLFGNFERIRLWIPGMLFFLVLCGALINPYQRRLRSCTDKCRDCVFQQEHVSESCCD